MPTVRSAEYKARKNAARRERYANDPEYREAMKAKNRAYSRPRHLAEKYRMTEEQFTFLLDAQGGLCAICGTSEPGGYGTWHVDHDPRCCPRTPTCGSCTRGLLCFSCNTTLGKFGDDPDKLAAAAFYVISRSALPGRPAPH